MPPSFSFERVPDLRSPVLVVAFQGWIDAGMAGAGAVSLLANQLPAARRFATLDLDDDLDSSQTRPQVRLRPDGSRRIDWPTVELMAGRLGPDIVVATGPEPSLRWQWFASEVVAAALGLGVTRAFLLAGLPVPVSHRRATEVRTSVSGCSEPVGLARLDYRGPTGAQTVVQHALGRAGIPAVGLWAEVPNYVSGSPCPPAMRALLVALRQYGALEVETGDLDELCESYRERLEDQLTDRPEITALVDALDDAPDVPSGDELAAEIERYLRGK
jgi:hypothetical protein